MVNNHVHLLYRVQQQAYLVRLDALNVAGEVEVEAELADVPGFVVLAAWSGLAALRSLLLQGRLGVCDPGVVEELVQHRTV